MVDKKQNYWAAQTIGRRKSSIARVFVTSGEGGITVNKRAFEDYFPKATSRYVVTQPLEQLNLKEKFNIRVSVRGGGVTGQSGAIRLGIARALIKVDPSLRAELKKAGFLVRDSRRVERKKYGRRGARRSFQFSKR